MRQALVPIPRHLPQTAQAAEYVAYAVAMRLVERRASLASDCKRVVKMGNAPIEKAISSKAAYAGLLLDTSRWPFQRDRVDLRWVPAHREETGDEDCETLCDIRGNALADELAKMAAKRHEELSAELLKGVKWHTERARHVIRAIGTALALFPPAPGNMERRTREERE